MEYVVFGSDVYILCFSDIDSVSTCWRPAAAAWLLLFPAGPKLRPHVAVEVRLLMFVNKMHSESAYLHQC